MKILVIGKSGQLACSLVERASYRPGIKMIAIGRPKIDLNVPRSAEDAILEQRPDLVINAAADTDVDGAEEHRLHAFRLNAEAAGEISDAAASVDAPIIQLSTDYVFDGQASKPYREEAPTGPVNAYGRSKLAGEEAVRAANPNHLILRTAWVYSPFGRNFVRTMFEAAEVRDQLRVVSDQRGNPTSALDLAEALLKIAENWRVGGNKGLGETYHLAGSGEASWFDLAKQVMDCRRQLGLKAAELVPISASDWPMRAVRPQYSALNSSKFAQDFNGSLPPWRESVELVVARLVAAR